MLDTPLLEQTELFVRKSGGELTTQLYSFVDPGGNRVSLRPEFTSSVIRHYPSREAHPVSPCGGSTAGRCSGTMARSGSSRRRGRSS